jgi:hypothetical protein
MVRAPNHVLSVVAIRLNSTARMLTFYGINKSATLLIKIYEQGYNHFRWRDTCKEIPNQNEVLYCSSLNSHTQILIQNIVLKCVFFITWLEGALMHRSLKWLMGRNRRTHWWSPLVGKASQFMCMDRTSSGVTLVTYVGNHVVRFLYSLLWMIECAWDTKARVFFLCINVCASEVCVWECADELLSSIQCSSFIQHKWGRVLIHAVQSST